MVRRLQTRLAAFNVTLLHLSTAIVGHIAHTMAYFPIDTLSFKFASSPSQPIAYVHLLQRVDVLHFQFLLNMNAISLQMCVRIIAGFSSRELMR